MTLGKVQLNTLSASSWEVYLKYPAIPLVSLTDMLKAFENFSPILVSLKASMLFSIGKYEKASQSPRNGTVSFQHH